MMGWILPKGAAQHTVNEAILARPRTLQQRRQQGVERGLIYKKFVCLVRFNGSYDVRGWNMEQRRDPKQIHG